MDKYEFNLKIEQLKKLVHEEDYYTALKIVDGIEWDRVRNINLLTMAATVYEKNERFDDSKNILIQAYKRAPSGKRILFKLTELAVRTGDIKAAEDYYYEYRQTDPEDINIYLLQYMILKARHAPYERQLEPLELYCNEETDERWLYELACTYDYAGRADDVIKTCDRIALMFGDSRFSLKALRLKMRYTALTDAQKNILYPRSISADGEEDRIDGFAAFDRDYKGYRVNEGKLPRERQFEDYGLMEEPDPGKAGVVRQDAVEEYEDIARKEREAKKNSDHLAAMRYEDEDAVFSKYLLSVESNGSDMDKNPDAGNILADDKDLSPETESAKESQIDNVPKNQNDEESKIDEMSEDDHQMEFDFGSGVPKVVDRKSDDVGFINKPVSAVQISEETTEPGKNGDVSQAVNDVGEIAKVSSDSGTEDVIWDNKGNLSDNIKNDLNTIVRDPVTNYGSDMIKDSHDRSLYSPHQISSPQSESQPKPKPMTLHSSTEEVRNHLIVEALDETEGLKIAISELKRIHELFHLDHASVKTSAEKLNKIGFTKSVMKKISGKDFVIESAGGLRDEILREIYNFIRTDESGAVVVLIDTPDGMDHIEDTVPKLFDICEYVTDIEDEDADEGDSYDYEDDEDYEDDDSSYDEESEEIKGDNEQEPALNSKSEIKNTQYRKRSLGTTKERFSNFKNISAKPGVEMESDDFAQYCMQYAEKIDCSISGTSMLALYERIELMEEDGIALTKETAEDLIEEAADRAEKPPIGDRLKGMFRSKYDKNGCLILREKDFIY